MMTLQLTLDPTSSSKVSRRRVECVFHEFVKCTTIPAADSKHYARANMFGVINVLGALQDHQLKNDHPLGVPLPSVYTIKLH